MKLAAAVRDVDILRAYSILLRISPQETYKISARSCFRLPAYLRNDTAILHIDESLQLIIFLYYLFDFIILFDYLPQYIYIYIYIYIYARVVL
jgi:hypothetical protein